MIGWGTYDRQMSALAESSQDVFRKSLAFMWFAFIRRDAGGGYKQFLN